MQKALVTVGLLLGMVVFTGCTCTPKSKVGESCAKTADCESGLRCVQLMCIDVEKERAEATQRCQETKDYCKVHGMCTAGNIKSLNGSDTCVADSDADCERSHVCKEKGRCTANNGRCIVESDADCKQSSGCKSKKICTAKNGGCVRIFSDADCQKEECKARGNCVASKDKLRCIAGSNADCSQARVCKGLGQCTAKGGQCIADSNTICKQSMTCKALGRCTVREDRCAVSSSADCQLSDICKTQGRCIAKGGQCIPRAKEGEQCASTADCQIGLECVPQRKDNTQKCTNMKKACLQSYECKTWGHCTYKPGGSMPSDRADTDACVVGSDEGCRQCMYCDRDGKCTARGDKCVVATDADCRRSKRCRIWKHCTARNGKCVD